MAFALEDGGFVRFILAPISDPTFHQLAQAIAASVMLAE